MGNRKKHLQQLARGQRNELKSKPAQEPAAPIMPPPVFSDGARNLDALPAPIQPFPPAIERPQQLPNRELCTLGDIDELLDALNIAEADRSVNLIGPGFVSVLVAEDRIAAVRDAIRPRQLIMTKIEVAALTPTFDPKRYQK